MSDAPPTCANGCGQYAFRSFPTCCVRCDGLGAHNHDCAEKSKQTLAAFESKKRKRDDMATAMPAPNLDPASDRVWSDPIELIDGLSYRWKDRGQVVEVEFVGSCKADGSMGKGPAKRSVDYLSTRGYIGFNDSNREQYLLLKINDEVLIPQHLGECFMGGMNGNVVSTSFKKQTDAVIDLTSTPILLKLDAAGAAAADAQRRTAQQHPCAFGAFLDQCGTTLAVELTSSDTSNKATYADLTVRTPGGTTFELQARMGGVFMSERRLKANLQANKVAQLRELESLDPNGVGTYCRVRLVAQGADLLQIGPDGFIIRPP